MIADRFKKKVLTKVKKIGKSFVDYLKPEDHLQKAITDYISLQYPEMLVYHSPNEGKRSKFEQFLIKFLGVKKGFPDLVIFYNWSNMALEVKTLTGKLSIEQENWLCDLRNNGWYAQWCLGLTEAIVHIDNFKLWADGKRCERIQAPEFRKVKRQGPRATAPNYRKGRGRKK